MKTKTLYLFLILFPLTLSGQGGVNYLRKSNYGNLSLSIADLKKLVLAVKYFRIGPVNDTSSASKHFNFTCELSDKNNSIAFTNLEQLDRLRLDKTYTDLVFRCESENPSLSDVTIELHSFEREVSIRGTDPVKIEALFLEINLELQDKEGFIPWMNWGILFSVFCWLVFNYSMITLPFLIIKLTQKTATTTNLIQLFIVVVCLILLVGFYFSPITIDELFPRFTIKMDSATWWDKNSSLIGAISSIITILTVFYNLYTWIKNKQKVEKPKTKGIDGDA